MKKYLSFLFVLGAIGANAQTVINVYGAPAVIKSNGDVECSTSTGDCSTIIKYAESKEYLVSLNTEKGTRLFETDNKFVVEDKKPVIVDGVPVKQGTVIRFNKLIPVN